MEFNSGDIKLEDNMGNGSEACVACLVAVGRVQPSIRFAIDDAIHRGRQVSISPTFYVRLFVQMFCAKLVCTGGPFICCR